MSMQKNIKLLIWIIIFTLIGINYISNKKSTPPHRKQKTKIEKSQQEIVEEKEACKKDLDCWGNKHKINMGVLCENQVEKLSKYSFEWTVGSFNSKFSNFQWKDKSLGYITYIGDNIKFQNGFSAWQNMIYECDVDPETETILDVRVMQGRL
jgi:hypothetical protein